MLNGANTYSGGTTINGGTLMADLSSLPGDIRDNAILLFGSRARAPHKQYQRHRFRDQTGRRHADADRSQHLHRRRRCWAQHADGNSSSLPGDIVNNGAIVFDQEQAGTYAGGMAGGGTFTKVGSGSLTLTGTNSFSGSDRLRRHSRRSSGSLRARSSTIRPSSSTRRAPAPTREP